MCYFSSREEEFRYIKSFTEEQIQTEMNYYNWDRERVLAQIGRQFYLAQVLNLNPFTFHVLMNTGEGLQFESLRKTYKAETNLVRNKEAPFKIIEKK